MSKESDLKTKVERLDVKLGALPGSTSKWTTLEKMALFDMARDVVTAFFAEREPQPPVSEPEEGPDDGGEVDVDVTVATKDGRATISFTVPVDDLAVLESFIDIDMLNKIAAAVEGKLAAEKNDPLQNATPTDQ